MSEKEISLKDKKLALELAIKSKQYISKKDALFVLKNGTEAFRNALVQYFTQEEVSFIDELLNELVVNEFKEKLK